MSVLAMELRLSCINPSIYGSDDVIQNGRRDLAKYRGSAYAKSLI